MLVKARIGSPAVEGQVAAEVAQVLDRFYRTGAADSADLMEAAQLEQIFASPEGHAALYCLIGWVRAQVYARAED